MREKRRMKKERRGGRLVSVLYLAKMMSCSIVDYGSDRSIEMGAGSVGGRREIHSTGRGVSLVVE